MKFLLSFLTFGFAAAASPIQRSQKAVKVDNVKADSPLGSKLLSKARKLENEGEVDFTWVADFSIKFQGCHHVSQWNGEAEDDEDVRIVTKRLIRFRLCPTDTCTESASGCTSEYGDYIIDMNTFLETYYEAVDEYNEYKCEYTMQMLCDCDDDDGKSDDFDEEICEYDCYVANGIEDICAENNPYNDDEQEDEDQFELAEWAECREAEFENDEERRLDEEEEIAYYTGPYCAEQGGAIYLGLFTDDTCSTFADESGGASTYSQLAGQALPYSAESIIHMDCISCKEPADYNEDGNDNQDEDAVVEMCETIYATAGKCEPALEATGHVYQANENACNYISGIKVIRKDGMITQVGSKANKTASIFIGIFVVAFVLLAAYVYYLKLKLDRASINLSD
jgi:hypothetical protein